MAVAIRFATNFVVGVLVIALAAASRSGVLALLVGGAHIGVSDAVTSFLTTSLSPLALSILFARALGGVTPEASEETSGREVDVLAPSVVDANSLGLENAALNAADLVVRVPDAHVVGGAKSGITFVSALSAASRDGGIPHAAVVTITSSHVWSDELALGTTLELTNRPIAHRLTFAVEGVNNHVAGLTAFT